MNKLYLLLSILLFTSCGLLKPTVTPLDRDADVMITEGKRLLQNQRYEDALDKFEMVRERDFNRSTTAAIFLSGLAAYYLEYNDIAAKRFATIIEEYDKSRYVPDAKYHQALIWMRSRRFEERRKGLENLIELSKYAANSKMKADADNQVKLSIFEDLPIADVERLYDNPPPGFKQEVFEALAYRKVSNGEINGARLLYQQHIKNGGKDSEFLKKMFPEKELKPIPELFEPNILRIAMCLPLHLDDPQTIYGKDIPAQTQLGLEFYEGFKLAVDLYGPKARKEIFVKIVDTRRDTNVVKSFFRQLNEIRPNIIVGEIYNTPSKKLSEWAEENKTIQIIPISATAELVEEKNYVFLAHPSAFTHGKKMAEYAFKELNLKRAAVFTDGTSATERLVDGFCSTFSELGGFIDTLKLDTDYKDVAIEQIPNLVRRIPRSDSVKTCVYIPLMGNEESASLIVNVLKKEARKVVIMGSPHFRSRYNTLDRDTKEGFGLLFSTSHFNDTESDEYYEMYNEYLKRYDYPPSDNVIQGYDLGMYIMKMYEQYSPSLGMTLDRYLRVYPRFRGIHLNYKFDGTQSNQQVNIGKYTPEGIIRVETKD
ncbi:MAG: ABC transporter substrate-binding protein [Bacteroidetes bacterium]|nr:ABC transporter substrate-binding protein [Bacteroidota bacterium]